MFVCLFVCLFVCDFCPAYSAESFDVDVFVLKYSKIALASASVKLWFAIGDKYSIEDKTAARQLIEELEAKYYIITKELFQSKEYLEAGNDVVKEHFNFMKSFAVQVFNVFQERALLAQGELISTKLFNLYLSFSSI